MIQVQIPIQRVAARFRTATFFLFGACLLSSCAMFESRPAKQLAYAEAAFQAATSANAEGNPNTAPVYLLAKDNLAKARSYYRLKNFKEARVLAIKARRLAEEAEWKALRGDSDSNRVESLVK